MDVTNCEPILMPLAHQVNSIGRSNARPKCGGMAQMKLIRLDGTRTGRLILSEPAPDTGRATRTHESFRSSWPSESHVGTDRTEQQTEKFAMKGRSKVANDSLNMGTQGAALAKRNETAGETNATAGTSAGRLDNSFGDRSALVELQAGTLVKPRQELAATAVPAGRAVKIKQNNNLKAEPGAILHDEAASTSGAAPLPQIALTVAAVFHEVPASGNQANAPKEPCLATEPMPGGSQLPARPSINGVPLAGDQPQVVTSKGGPLESNPGESNKAVRAAQRRTDLRDEVRNLTSADGTLPFANGLHAGSSSAEGVLFPLQLGHSSSTSVRDSKRQVDIRSGIPHATDSAPQVIASTPVRLDVGVFNETHGWLRIRAELGSGGAVNASVTTIDSAHDALRTAVPEITSYLGVESVRISSLEVHRFADGFGASDAMGRSEGQSDSGQQRSEQGEDRQQQAGEVAQRVLVDSTKDLMSDNSSGRVERIDVQGRNALSIASSAAWGSRYSGRGTCLSVCA
jgi:hypothetical protein